MTVLYALKEKKRMRFYCWSKSAEHFKKSVTAFYRSWKVFVPKNEVASFDKFMEQYEAVEILLSPSNLLSRS